MTPPEELLDTANTEDLGQRFGNDALRHLVYVSKASPSNDAHTLTDILRVSRRNNHAAGITGLLVFFDGRFLQYLEGPGLAVHGTLSQIKDDSRHHDMHVLLDERAHTRLFRTWDMGCLDVGSDNWRRLVEADWPTIPRLKTPGATISGLQVLQELAAHPAEPQPDRVKVFGSRAPDEDPIVVNDVPAELRKVKLQLILAVLVGVILAGLLVYSWLR